jgi:tRNA(Met) C34 N-acetyltransferase TmcA
MVAGLAACAPAASTGGDSGGDGGLIGVAMPTKSSERWIQDGDAVKQQLEDAGYTVAGASTAAVASAGLAAEAGITSRTIASWLLELEQPDRPGLAGIDVLVVDEAAMVDDRAIHRPKDPIRHVRRAWDLEERSSAHALTSLPIHWR